MLKLLTRQTCLFLFGSKTTNDGKDVRHNPAKPQSLRIFLSVARARPPARAPPCSPCRLTPSPAQDARLAAEQHEELSHMPLGIARAHAGVLGGAFRSVLVWQLALAVGRGERRPLRLSPDAHSSVRPHPSAPPASLRSTVSALPVSAQREARLAPIPYGRFKPAEPDQAQQNIDFGYYPCPRNPEDAVVVFAYPCPTKYQVRRSALSLSCAGSMCVYACVCIRDGALAVLHGSGCRPADGAFGHRAQVVRAALGARTLGARRVHVRLCVRVRVRLCVRVCECACALWRRGWFWRRPTLCVPCFGARANGQAR